MVLVLLLVLGNKKSKSSDELGGGSNGATAPELSKSAGRHLPSPWVHCEPSDGDRMATKRRYSFGCETS
jgi:hypothetical protein